MVRKLSFAFVLLVLWHAPASAQPKKLDPEVATLVAGNSDFGLTMYRQLATKDGNVFLSPYSISNALAMTLAGARGNTAEEMKTTLRFGLAEDRLHPTFSKLIGQLDGPAKSRPFQLTVANRLWGQKDYGFLSAFLKIGADHYRAGLEEVDFAKAPDAARKTINAWVEKKTKDKIKNLLPEGIITVDTRLVLTNAIYFKAPWLNPFDPKQTRPGDFHLAAGKTTKVPMMQGRPTTNFADLGDLMAVQLPYQGYQQSMLVLLPKKKDGLANLEKQLTADNVSKWTAKLSRHEVDLKLPRFKVTAEFNLKDVLMQMGMKDAFVADKADFSGMASRDKLFIQAVVHKAFVDVNEIGTEAAAATGVAIGTASLPPPATFHADHPFIFLIQDHVTGSILFVGRVTNPVSMP